MYAPVQAYLGNLGFAVSAEVRGCDVVATCADLVVVVELKRAFGLRLVYQGLERQLLTSLVFLCVPRPKVMRSSSYRNMERLVKRLGLGLMFVAMDSPLKRVEVAILPDHAGRVNSAALAKLLKEATGRTVGRNTGGASRTKLNTAYRERAIMAACALEAFGQLSAKALKNTYGCMGNVQVTLYKNIYGWFERTQKGVYRLSQAGREFLQTSEHFSDIITHYREHFKNLYSIPEMPTN